MTYLSIADMHDSATLRRRLTACAAQEGKGGLVGPEKWLDAHAWALAAQPGWADAWAYAVASNNPDPGADAGVITDGMILAAVQPMDP